MPQLPSFVGCRTTCSAQAPTGWILLVTRFGEAFLHPRWIVAYGVVVVFRLFHEAFADPVAGMY
jgi:hypothetical protein